MGIALSQLVQYDVVHLQPHSAIGQVAVAMYAGSTCKVQFCMLDTTLHVLLLKSYLVW